MEEIVNRVAKSPLISVDLDEFIHKGDIEIFDMKGVLFQEMILREKDFRDFLKTNDWSAYQDKNVGLICSADAIVPIWAYMLLVTKLKEFANIIVYGSESEVEKAIVDQAIDKCIIELDLGDKKVVIKGCGNISNKEYAYTAITNKLLPKVASVMYGEPCSTVPVYKRKS